MRGPAAARFVWLTERRKNKEINPVPKCSGTVKGRIGGVNGRAREAGSNQCEWKWTLGRPIVLHASGSRWMSRAPKTAERARISPKRRTLGPRQSVAPPHPVVLRMPRCELRIRGISGLFIRPINRTSLSRQCFRSTDEIRVNETSASTDLMPREIVLLPFFRC